MKTNYFFLFLILMQSDMKLEAQTQKDPDSLKTKLLKFNKYISMGFGFGLSEPLSYGNQENFLGDVLDANIASQLLELDKGHKYENGSGDALILTWPYVKFGFIPYSRKKKGYNYKREIQFGISHHNAEGGFFAERERKDSVTYSEIKYIDRWELINLDVVYLFEIFNIREKFNGRLGLGGSGGKSYNSILMRRSLTDTSDIGYSTPRASLINIELKLIFECNIKISKRISFVSNGQWGYQQMFLKKKKNVPIIILGNFSYGFKYNFN